MVIQHDVTECIECPLAAFQQGQYFAEQRHGFLALPLLTEHATQLILYLYSSNFCIKSSNLITEQALGFAQMMFGLHWVRAFNSQAGAPNKFGTHCQLGWTRLAQFLRHLNGFSKTSLREE